MYIICYTFYGQNNLIPYWNPLDRNLLNTTQYGLEDAQANPKKNLCPLKLNDVGVRLIHEIFNKYAVQHKASDPDVMPWLPKEPIPELIELPMDATQKKALKELEEWFETEGEEIIAKNGLDRITKYRQIIGEPRILLETKTLGPKSKWF